MMNDARLAVWQQNRRISREPQPVFAPEVSPLIEISQGDEDQIEHEVHVTGGIEQAEQGKYDMCLSGPVLPLMTATQTISTAGLTTTLHIADGQIERSELCVTQSVCMENRLQTAGLLRRHS